MKNDCYKILIIEDDKMDLMAFRRMADNTDYLCEFDVSTSFKSGLDQIKNNDYVTPIDHARSRGRSDLLDKLQRVRYNR